MEVISEPGGTRASAVRKNLLIVAGLATIAGILAYASFQHEAMLARTYRIGYSDMVPVMVHNPNHAPTEVLYPRFLLLHSRHQLQIQLGHDLGCAP